MVTSRIPRVPVVDESESHHESDSSDSDSDDVISPEHRENIRPLDAAAPQPDLDDRARDQRNRDVNFPPRDRPRRAARPPGHLSDFVTDFSSDDTG